MSSWSKPPFATVASAEDDEDRISFFRKLHEFLTKTKSEGINKDGSLHKEVEGFDKKYRVAIPETVQICLEKLTSSSQLNIIGKLLELCLEHLVPRVERYNGSDERSETEKIVDELFARTMAGILGTLTRSTTKPENAAAILPVAYRQLLKYVLSMPHKCNPPDECKCYEGNPIDSMVETVTLVTAAKHVPDSITQSFENISKHYHSAISVKWVMAIGLLYSEHNKLQVGNQQGKIARDLKSGLDAKTVTETSAVIMPTGGSAPLMIVQERTSDFILLGLDFLKKIAEKNPKTFLKETVSVVEEFLVEKLGPIAPIAVQVLRILSQKNPMLLSGRGAGYLEAAKELNLDYTSLLSICSILVIAAENSNGKADAYWEMGKELNSEKTDISKAILQSWGIVQSKYGLTQIEKWKESIEKFQDQEETKEHATKILRNLRNKPEREENKQNLQPKSKSCILF